MGSLGDNDKIMGSLGDKNMGLWVTNGKMGGHWVRAASKRRVFLIAHGAQPNIECPPPRETSIIRANYQPNNTHYTVNINAMFKRVVALI